MRMEGIGWVLRGRGLSRGAGKPWFHGLGDSGLRPRRAKRAGLGCVPGLSRRPQAQRTADHSGHSRVASSRPGQWGRAGGHQERSQCPSPRCCLSDTPCPRRGCSELPACTKGPGGKGCRSAGHPLPSLTSLQSEGQGQGWGERAFYGDREPRRPGRGWPGTTA